jgi:toxin ParE1/3/4
MDFKVVFMRRAVRDLEIITAQIAREDPQAAERFGLKLIEEALTLGRFPRIGRVVPEFGDPTLREIIHGRYRIIYRVREAMKRIHIIRFWHAARGKPEI